MSYHSLPNAEIIRQCQQERLLFKSNPTPQLYCLELIRRAFVDWVQEAFQEVDNAYGDLWRSYVTRTPQYAYLERLEGMDVSNDIVQVVYTQLSVKFRDMADFELKFGNDLGRFKAFFRKSIYNAVVNSMRIWKKAVPSSDELAAPLADEPLSPAVRKIALDDITELVGAEDSYAELYSGQVVQRARHAIERDDEFLLFVCHFYYGMSDNDITTAYPQIFKDKPQLKNTLKRVVYRLSTDPLFYDMLVLARDSQI